MKTTIKKIIILITTVPFLIFFGITSYAKKMYEKDYVSKWCKKGVIEYRLPDRTRVDCFTKNHAIEYDFARKWYEAVGQSLHYSRLTRKKAGVVLILKSARDNKYVGRIKGVIKHHNLKIDLWIIQNNKLSFVKI